MTAVLRYHPHEVEADVARFYPGRRLAEWWRWLFGAPGTHMSSRELWVLISQLPDDSATKAAIREDPWTQRDHLLADVVDVLGFLRADYGVVHGAKRQPDTVPRPARELQKAQEREEARRTQRALHDVLHGRIQVETTAVGEREPLTEIT